VTDRGDGSGRGPAVGAVVAAIVSVQLGAGFAVGLFGRVGALGVVGLRLVGSALVLSLAVGWRRRTGRRARGSVGASVGTAGTVGIEGAGAAAGTGRGRTARVRTGRAGTGQGRTRRGLVLAGAFGLVLAGMNASFYQALDRLPQGAAVTIEFTGPLALSLCLSRRRRDLLWVVLAAAGVLALGWGGLHRLDGVGVLFALAAAVCWACYILLSRRVGQHFAGLDGLLLASVVAAVAVLPLAVSAPGSRLLDPTVLGVGLAVAVLSSALPYALELQALRTLDERTFGVLMSAEPAVAALVGLVVLGQRLQPVQVVGVVLVALASAGSTLRSAPARTVPAHALPAHSPPAPDRIPGPGEVPVASTPPP